MRTLKKTNKLDRYHFLPKFDKIESNHVVDFQNVNTIDIGTDDKPDYDEYLKEREKLIKSYTRIASIASPFLKDLISRYSFYYSRQGQPNLLL